MTTSYSGRIKPNTTYAGRQWPQSNLWELADTLGNLIRTTDGRQIRILGKYYSSDTPYSIRTQP